ncbi:unknown protein [Seminavis robusta]|uniref:Uncharacterized protein n=1 Tax=Seminavis robusta TaxID=568900 RepID=A0A9N8HSF7_9STRA|nr:unknown protein [Seminavis robusta]|eukprot:Sro1516_g279070.1 n/a (422) ;mRNA; r:1451-2716
MPPFSSLSSRQICNDKDPEAHAVQQHMQSNSTSLSIAQLCSNKIIIQLVIVEEIAMAQPPVVELLGDDGKENAAAVSSSSSTKNKELTRWPPVSRLVAVESDLVSAIFQAVDECDATKCTEASNNDNVKKNGWTRFHDVCYGGGADGRELLVRRLPKITQATQMKKKVTALWQYILDNPEKVRESLYTAAVQQSGEHETAKKTEKESTEKAKAKAALLQEQMKNYERGVGALPPGANGDSGAGRSGHSTNLALGHPSSFAYANATTANTDFCDLFSGGIGDDGATMTTPKRNLSPPKSESVNGSDQKKQRGPRGPTTTVNDNAMQTLENLGNTFQSIATEFLGSKAAKTTPGSTGGTSEPSDITSNSPREKRIALLEKKKKSLMEDAAFYPDATGFENEYKETMLEFGKVRKELLSLYEQA